MELEGALLMALLVDAGVQLEETSFQWVCEGLLGPHHALRFHRNSQNSLRGDLNSQPATNSGIQENPINCTYTVTKTDQNEALRWKISVLGMKKPPVSAGTFCPLPLLQCNILIL
jgi:hypothetical protein